MTLIGRRLKFAVVFWKRRSKCRGSAVGGSAAGKSATGLTRCRRFVASLTRSLILELRSLSRAKNIRSRVSDSLLANSIVNYFGMAYKIFPMTSEKRQSGFFEHLRSIKLIIL